jgi:formate-dependent nitrite reductase membrane component NrfD
MDELLLTRSNHLVDPTMHVWAWQIPVYLFLGGWVAGMMVLSGWRLWEKGDSFLFQGGRTAEKETVTFSTPWLGLVLLSLGMGALFLDLEHKKYVWRLYTTFEPTSPMSWGSWILLLVYPALLAAALVRPPGWLGDLVLSVERAGTWFATRPGAVRVVAVANILLGIALGIYTGILLSALGARPLWNSALLGPLFLFSGLSSAAAFVHLVARSREEREWFARADIVFLGIELVLIALLLVGLLSSTQAHRDAAGLVLGGPYTAVFWVLVVGLGIVAPLVIQPLAVTHRVQHTPIAPLLVLAGGLALRFVMVEAGQVSHWAGRLTP